MIAHVCIVLRAVITVSVMAGVIDGGLLGGCAATARAFSRIRVSRNDDVKMVSCPSFEDRLCFHLRDVQSGACTSFKVAGAACCSTEKPGRDVNLHSSDTNYDWL